MIDKCSILLGIFGRYEALTYQLQRKINQIKELSEEYEIVISIDGGKWKTAPMIQLLHVKLPKAKIVLLDQCTNLPAKVFNAGMREITGKYIIFSTLYGTDVANAAYKFSKAISEYNKREHAFALGRHLAFYLRPTGMRESPIFFDEALYGQAQCSDSLHIDEWCIDKEIWEEMGGFPETFLLQEELERYATLAFIRYGEVLCAGTLAEQEMSVSLRELPFEKRLVQNRDLAKRYAIYSNAISRSNGRTHNDCLREFLQDISEEEANYVCMNDVIQSKRQTSNHPYKIYIIGGYWEYHHNQIGFFNYLENLYGSGFATFNVGLEHLVMPSQLDEYDLVIFTRCRSDHAIDLMEYCEQKEIPSVYMIDDNWFSIAKDYPEQGNIFEIGNSNFDNFIRALSLCKSTFVYNPIIRKMVLPYSKNVQMLPISVCEESFQAKTYRERKDKELYVGFSGSLRWNDVAFRALARVARRRKDIKIFLVGVLSKEQELYFTGIDVIRLPVMSYSVYAKKMAEIQPDLMVAPLDHNTTCRSKCANKYVESAIVGAACIYSDTEPYKSVVMEGINGYFVTDETDDGWFDKIMEVLDDIPRLRKVQKNARRDVTQNYSVKHLLPVFRQKITTVIEQEELIDD